MISLSIFCKMLSIYESAFNLNNLFLNLMVILLLFCISVLLTTNNNHDNRRQTQNEIARG